MIRHLFILMLLFLYFRCKTQQEISRQSFPEYYIALSCPCVLTRDTIKEYKIKTEIGNNSVSYFCTDSNSFDKYYLDILLDKSNIYSTKQIISAIDSTLTTRQIDHEIKKINYNEAVIINYGKAKELELFTEKLTYYLVVEATDSMEIKFDRLIKSIIVE